MSDEAPTHVTGAEVVETDQGDVPVETESVTEPAKVMRIGAMVRQLLEEVRGTQLDEPSRERLAEIYERSITEIASALSPDLADELHMLALPFKDGEVPSEGELRVATESRRRCSHSNSRHDTRSNRCARFHRRAAVPEPVRGAPTSDRASARVDRLGRHTAVILLQIALL